MIRNGDSLVLEHDILVGLNVVHVDALHFLLAFRVEAQAVPADMCEEEAALEVQRVLDGLGEFVVDPVDSNPIVDRALWVKTNEASDKAAKNNFVVIFDSASDCAKWNSC